MKEQSINRSAKEFSASATTSLKSGYPADNTQGILETMHQALKRVDAAHARLYRRRPYGEKTVQKRQLKAVKAAMHMKSWGSSWITQSDARGATANR